jgi:hypothetical protein
LDLANREGFGKWPLIHDPIRDGEMPLKKKKQPPVDEKVAFKKSLSGPMVQANGERIAPRFGGSIVSSMKTPCGKSWPHPGYRSLIDFP